MIDVCSSCCPLSLRFQLLRLITLLTTRPTMDVCSLVYSYTHGSEGRGCRRSAGNYCLTVLFTLMGGLAKLCEALQPNDQSAATASITLSHRRAGRRFLAVCQSLFMARGRLSCIFFTAVFRLISLLSLICYLIK